MRESTSNSGDATRRCWMTFQEKVIQPLTQHRSAFLDATPRRGVTYRKLLCIAFDLALILAHDGEGFPAFVYHDDALGSLDNRKRENLRDVMRSRADRGVQQVVTVIDSDLPSEDFFDDDEIILRLHDDGDAGRLFKMPEW